MVAFFDKQLLVRTVTGVVAGVIFLGGLLFLPLKPLCIVWGALWLYICSYEMPQLIPYKGWRYYLALCLYPTMPFLSLIALLLLDQTRTWVALLFATVFCHDTAAYVVGRLFGVHRMWPEVSPNKTWEGFFGGVVALLCIMLGSYKRGFTGWTAPLVLLFILLPFVATAGDLFVSYLKRRAGIKDTGTLLPGHGGVLDRADSILFAAPLFLAVYLITH